MPPHGRIALALIAVMILTVACDTNSPASPRPISERWWDSRAAPEIRPLAFRDWPINTFYEPGAVWSWFGTGAPPPLPKSVPLRDWQPFCVRGHVVEPIEGYASINTGLPYDNDQGAAWVAIPAEIAPPALVALGGDHGGGRTAVVVCGRYQTWGWKRHKIHSRFLSTVEWWGVIRPDVLRQPNQEMAPAG